MQNKPLNIVPREGLTRRLDASRVIAAAAQITDRDGLHQLTLAVVAEALGVKPPSLYAHVKNLSALRTGVAALGLRELTEKLGEAAMGRGGEDLVPALAHAYRAYAKARPGVYAASVAWSDDSDQAVKDASEKLTSLVLRILEPTTQHLEFVEQIHLLRLLRISLHGFVSLEASSGFQAPVNIDESFERLIKHLVNLVAQKPKG